MKRSIRNLPLWTPAVVVALLAIFCSSVGATNYYVSPLGNDTLSGLSAVNAWGNIDRGDQLGILAAGDSIFVLSGQYNNRTRAFVFNQSGSAAAPITYIAGITGTASFDASNRDFDFFQINASHVQIVGLELWKIDGSGFVIQGDSCRIADCLLKQVGNHAIRVYGGGNVISQNVISLPDSSGVINSNGASFNHYYNNTIYGAGGNGIDVNGGAVGVHIVNNIIVASQGNGIKGNLITHCAYNNVWGSGSGDYKDCADSAGGISADPLFANMSDFGLTAESPCIDAGMDVGFPYFGIAPDMGAVEFPSAINHAPVLTAIGGKTVIEGHTLTFGVSATDPDGTVPSLRLENLPLHAAFTDSGNGRGVFTFSPDYTQAGSYSVRFIAMDGALADSESVSMVVQPAVVTAIEITPQTATVEETGTVQFQVVGFDILSSPFVDLTDSVTWSTTDPGGSVTSVGLYIAGASISPPDYYVKAVYGGLFADSAEITIISAGVISSVRVETFDGRPFPDTSLTTDNDTTEIHCLGYDSGGNSLGDVSASWQVIGSASSGTISPGTGTMTKLTLFRPGSLRVVATYSASIADTSGLFTLTAGNPATLTVSPSQATVSADSTLQFTATFSDEDGNAVVSTFATSWSLIGGFGSISPTGLFTPLLIDTCSVVARNSALADTANPIITTSGRLQSLSVAPDSAEIDLGGNVQFGANGYDGKGNLADVGTLTWSAIGNIGQIDAAGRFAATGEGLGKIVARSNVGGVVDTNKVIRVLGRRLNRIVVSPDTASVTVGGLVLCDAQGYDAAYEPIDHGTLTWKVLGGIGTIDASGNFRATSRGAGKIVATSAASGISDTTRMYTVEVPTVTTIPLGNSFDYPGSYGAPTLAFSVRNSFDAPATLSGLRAHSRFRGAGSQIQMAANVDSLALYLDLDADGSFGYDDDLISTAKLDLGSTDFAFPAISLNRGGAFDFYILPKLDLFARDSDSIDLYLITGDDIITMEGISPSGLDTVNSLGYCIANGLVSDQVSIISGGNADVAYSSLPTRALTFDLPRNGYSADVLKAFSVINRGSASENDIDSLMLLRDNGDNIWNGAAAEIFVGDLAYTGEEWSISGISQSLTQTTTRFYLALKISASASHGATVAFAIPLKGIEMGSENDGPLNEPIIPKDTITVRTTELFSVSSVPLPSRRLIPGQLSEPLLAIQLFNSYSEIVRVDALRLTSTGTDTNGASRAELDSQIDSILLYLDGDDDIEHPSSEDVRIGTGTLVNGSVNFATGGLALPAENGRQNLFVQAAMSATSAKNGNIISFSVVDAAAITLRDSRTVVGDFPITNPHASTINAFPASLIQVNQLPGKTIYAGQTKTLVFDLELPRNGYSADHLASITLQSSGSQAVAAALTNVRLWLDADKNGLTPNDRLVGQFARTYNAWILEGISENLAGAQTRFLVTVDAGIEEVDGGTLQLQIPVSGIQYSSGTDGPDDRFIGNNEPHLILPSNRITVISLPGTTQEILPGSVGNPLLSFALYNGYLNATQTLNFIRFSNTSSVRSSAAYSDYELGQISLYHDANGNHTFEERVPLATGYFANGQVIFSGVNVNLPPDSVTYFQARVDVPLDVIDSEVLGIEIHSQSDLRFAGNVTIGGDLPLDNAEMSVVDGSVTWQYEVKSTPAGSVSPGDKNVCLFAMHPAFNGDLIDTLRSLTIGNEADADTTEIDSLRLWEDRNGDNEWDSADRFLGTFSFHGGLWTLEGINRLVTRTSPILFITGDIRQNARTGRAFQTQLPMNGCLFSSANDGPIDSALMGAQRFVISDARLRLVFLPERRTYSKGEIIRLSFRATNTLPQALSDVLVELTQVSNPELVSAGASFGGPISIPGGQSADFYFEYTAIGEGMVEWQFRAFSTITGDSSGTVSTGGINIQQVPPSISLSMIASTPTAVTRGQMHLYPFSIKYEHPESVGDAAPVRLDSLRLRIEDNNGRGRVAKRLFSRMAISSGYSVLAVIEDLPEDSSVLLQLSNPAAVSPGESRLLTLRVDIDSTAEGSFALVLNDEKAIAFADANSGITISVDEQVEFPLRTPPCRIDIASRDLAVAYKGSERLRANLGQNDVELMQLTFRHPGAPGSSPLQVTNIGLQFVDSNQAPVSAAAFVRELRLIGSQENVVGRVSAIPPQGSVLQLALSSTTPIPINESYQLSVRVDVNSTAPTSGFGIIVQDSTWFSARDISSGSVVPVVRDPLALITSTTFPFYSGGIRLLQPAVPPSVCLQSALTSSVVGGADSVSLMTIQFNLAGVPGASQTLARGIFVALHDTLGRSLDPYQLFDRVGYRRNDGEIVYFPSISLSGGLLDFEFMPNLKVSEQSLMITLLADLDAGAPYDHFVLTVQSAASFAIIDATDSSRMLLPDWESGCTGKFPFSTGSTKVMLPAAAPTISEDDLPAQIGARGETGLSVLRGRIDYTGGSALGDLRIGNWECRIMQRTLAGIQSVSINTIVTAVRLTLDSRLVATDSSFAGDRVNLVPTQPFVISHGSAIGLVLSCDIKADASLGNYYVEFLDPTSMKFIDQNLGTILSPNIATGSFPLQGLEFSINAANLENSFTNFPNPFNPTSDEKTTFAFVLDRPAEIEIEVFTITGELVKKIVAGEQRSAGTYQSDNWTGQNGIGELVTPGSYLCRLTARYSDGESVNRVRKVAVIR